MLIGTIVFFSLNFFIKSAESFLTVSSLKIFDVHSSWIVKAVQLLTYCKILNCSFTKKAIWHTLTQIQSIPTLKSIILSIIINRRNNLNIF